MKAFVAQSIIAIFRVMPARLRLGVVQLVMEAESKGTSRQALCNLFQMLDSGKHCLDKVAIAYEGGIHPKHRLTKYHDFFTSRLQSGERILDVGCGIGAVAYSMAKVGAYVTGVDMNEENICKAQKLYKHPHLTFMVGDLPRVKPAGFFDVLVLSNVLEHVEHRIEFLRKLQETFKPRRWLMRVPMFDRDWTVAMKNDLGLFPYSDPTHFTEYTRSSFQEEMKQAGLRIVADQVQWGEIWSEVHAPE